MWPFSNTKLLKGLFSRRKTYIVNIGNRGCLRQLRCQQNVSINPAWLCAGFGGFGLAYWQPQGRLELSMLKVLRIANSSFLPLF